MKKVFLFALALAASLVSFGQTDFKELYKKADDYQERYESKFYGGYLYAYWIGDTDYFWYSVNTRRGTEFFLVNAAKQKKTPAFNQQKLAAALSAATGKETDPYRLPLRSLTFNDARTEINFRVGGDWYKCNLKNYKLSPSRSTEAEEDYGDMWEYPQENNPAPVVSPDGTKEAYISEGDLFVRDLGTGEVKRLSQDGSPYEYYSSKIFWSPDSKKIVSSKYRPVEERRITLVESSPATQLEPIYHTFEYVKPGDALPVVRPTLFDVESGAKYEVAMEPADRQFYTNWFHNNIEWRGDSESFTFTYNKRGHSDFIIYKVDAATGESMELIHEKSDTFIDYRSLYWNFLEDTDEVVWLSERDGWKHIYLYDYHTGKVIRQLTDGEWRVKGIVHVDPAARTILFRAGGMDKGEDPYYNKYYIVHMDTGAITPLTPENATHWAEFSADWNYMVDTYSRVDRAPVTVLRDAHTGKVLMEVDRADISEMLADGYRMPEPFVAKGRDGVTDIYGIIMRPTDFDPDKKYPVIEYIYAGPHSSFVPKAFGVQEKAALCELGFIVVQIDGMGTNNRSKAFHDVCWKNLKDSGFPDRILWMQAAAEKYPEMDISNVGVYGFSAGGQSTMSALLFFGDFYKVGVASCGCYDNRMDKIWWNEQWMGEVGDHYDASSSKMHVENLKGKLMLLLGEIDDNVDPSSTIQVIDELIKHGKEFEFVILPGIAHTEGEWYGERKRRDFFVRHILKQTPPEWNE